MPLPNVPIDKIPISLEQTACYGTCPAYKVTIHGDGNVVYVGNNHVRIARLTILMGADTHRLEGYAGAMVGMSPAATEFENASMRSRKRPNGSSAHGKTKGNAKSRYGAVI